MRWLEASMITQTVYSAPGIREKIVRRQYTRDDVEMRSMRDPGEYLIVQYLCVKPQHDGHRTMSEVLL